MLVGLDWDSEASTFEKVTFVLEYPFSILRWISIATADQQWSQRRRILSAIAPMGMVTVVFLDFSSNWTGGKSFKIFSKNVFHIHHKVRDAVLTSRLVCVTNNTSSSEYLDTTICTFSSVHQVLLTKGLRLHSIDTT